jgi:hypothetical protein
MFAATGFDAAWDQFHEVAFPGSAADRPRHRPDQISGGVLACCDLPRVMCAAEAAIIAAVAAVYLFGSRGERTRLSSTIDVHASTTQAA